MNTNVEMIIEIAKRIRTNYPDLVHFLSEILFEVEKKKHVINRKGSLEAIKWCCYDSEIMSELHRDGKEYLESMMIGELAQM